MQRELGTFRTVCATGFTALLFLTAVVWPLYFIIFVGRAGDSARFPPMALSLLFFVVTLACVPEWTATSGASSAVLARRTLTFSKVLLATGAILITAMGNGANKRAAADSHERRTLEYGSHSEFMPAADLKRPASDHFPRTMPQRLSYEDSCRALQRQQIMEDGDIPPLPQQPPRYDDEGPLGVNFFRTELADSTLEHLSLPRTFFGRSEIRDVSFRETDLSESTANWNDFINVDFSSADLSRCDLRSSVFDGVRFTSASLRQADLRHSNFMNCDFSGADLTGAKLTRETASSISLSAEQQRAIDVQEDDGEEPGGG